MTTFPLLLVFGFASLMPQASSGQDALIYKAIIATTIRPEVVRMMGPRLTTEPVILVSDQTLAMCRLNFPPPKIGCIPENDIGPLEVPDRRQQLGFQGLLTAKARAELIVSFRDRNLRDHPFASTSLDNVIAVPADYRAETVQRESARTTGWSSFSTPAYSSDGHAVVYASYVCGGLCGYAWLFLLEQRHDEWVVVRREVLWVS